MDPKYFSKLGCEQCASGKALDFDISFAYQPIVSASQRCAVGYEALVRGPEGQSAGEVFKQVNDENLYRFDQTCRVKAIALAVELDLQTPLHVNFSPNAVYRPELCIRTTIQAATRYGLPIQHIVFEVTEIERVKDKAHLANIVNYYKKLGFGTAIDDFGDGYAGLSLLAEFQPDKLKLDRSLVDGIHDDPVKQAIAAGMIQICRDLSIDLLAEGVEQRQEYEWLNRHGVDLFQGYYFARPAFQALPAVTDDKF